MLRSCIILTTIIFVVSGCAPNNVSFPGQLKLPQDTIERRLNSGDFRDEERVIKVVAGDTIYSIAKRHGVTPRQEPGHDRLSINIIAEVGNKHNRLFKLIEVIE